jgi:AcrR family transcriptional regulator
LAQNGDVSKATSRQRRPRDAEATRRDLLRAAQRRFAVLGYDRTTTRDVADDAGVNLTLINRYFGGKRGLFEAAVASAPELVSEYESDGGDIVSGFLDGLRPGAWPDFGGHHPLLLLLRDSSAEDKIQALRSAAMASAATRIAQVGGRDRGEPGSPERRESELRAHLVLALFSGIIALRSMAPSEPLASADVDNLRNAITDAITALVGPPRPDQS